jgi:hypothetical protein
VQSGHVQVDDGNFVMAAFPELSPEWRISILARADILE